MNLHRLSGLRDINRVSEWLKKAGGESGEVSLNDAHRFSKLGQMLEARHPADTPISLAFVPGRIEVLGKHTDYAGGRSLLAATRQGFCGVAAVRDDDLVNISDVERHEERSFRLDLHEDVAVGDWSNYPITVVRRVISNLGPPWQGMDLVFSNNLPIAAGLSSSSALMILVFLLFVDANRRWQDDALCANVLNRNDLAAYLGTVENGQSFRELSGDRGVGTFGGSQDHTAILCAEPNRLVQYSFCPTQWERRVMLPAELVFAIGVSGVVAEKTRAALEKYNRVAQCSSVIAKLWRQATGGDELRLADILHSRESQSTQPLEVLAKHRNDKFGSDELQDRWTQFVTESDLLIPAVPDELTDDQCSAFGRLVARSQECGARCLRNQVPETEFLAASARQHGAVAASAFGAGFGGSVWALVRRGEVASFLQDWSTSYRAEYPELDQRSTFFHTTASAPAFLMGGRCSWLSSEGCF